MLGFFVSQNHLLRAFLFKKIKEVKINFKRENKLNKNKENKQNDNNKILAELFKETGILIYGAVDFINKI